MFKSVCFSVLILLSVSVFETAIVSNISFLPAVPDFLLLCIIYMALLNGRSYGSTVGFISGLFWDFLTGCPFGFNMLLRTLLGYFPGFFSKSINYNGFFIPAAFGLIGTIVKVILTWLISLFFPNLIVNYNIISLEFLFELVCNCLFAPFVFRLLRNFARLISLFDGDL
ncbi:MAG: rod shape-determining protein MreD [Treponema sp.]|nr:rod shape-determining protein MreD [Treponema sp.]